MTTYTVAPSGAGGADYDGLANVTVVAAGDTLSALDGTYLDEGLEIPSTGSAGNRVTIQAANPGKAIFDGDSFSKNNGINGSIKRYITVDGIAFTGYGNAGIQLVASATIGPDNVVVQNNSFDTMNGSGISLGVSGNTVDVSGSTYSGVVVQGNRLDEIRGHGVAVSGACAGAVVSYNTVTHAANDTVNRWGLYCAPNSTSASETWTLVSGTRYSLTLSAIGFTNKVVQRVIADGRTPTDAKPYHLTEGSGANQWSFAAGVVEIDIGEDPSNKAIILLFTEMSDVVMHDNVVSYTEINGGTDGVGMGVDHGGEDCLFLRNHTFSNDGDGIQNHAGVACIATGNLSHDNGRAGITFAAPGGSSHFYQNTCVNNVAAQFSLKRTAIGSYTEATNCIAVGGTHGFGGEDLGLFAVATVNYSCAYNNSTADFDWISSFQNITTDPQFISEASDDYRLNGSSPCAEAGLRWWGTDPPPTGQDGLRFSRKPAIGAYQPSAHDGATRSPLVLSAAAGVYDAGVDIAKVRAA